MKKELLEYFDGIFSIRNFLVNFYGGLAGVFFVFYFSDKMVLHGNNFRELVFNSKDLLLVGFIAGFILLNSMVKQVEFISLRKAMINLVIIILACIY